MSATLEIGKEKKPATGEHAASFVSALGGCDERNFEAPPRRDNARSKEGDGFYQMIVFEYMLTIERMNEREEELSN